MAAQYIEETDPTKCQHQLQHTEPEPEDTSESSKPVGRPRVDQEIEDLVIRMARENRSWGSLRIQGALRHPGYTISDQTVGDILKRLPMVSDDVSVQSVKLMNTGNPSPTAWARS